jgi:S1-C subfamily serine protease
MKYKKIIGSITVLFFVMVLLIAYSFIYDYLCKTRVYSDISQKISDEVLSANLQIVQCKTEGDSVRYSAGFGAVVFQKVDNRYYVLTAYHAVNSLENTILRVLNYNAKVHFPLKEYYERLPVATVEYYDEKYDLAILSFQSGENISVLKIADSSPNYKERIVCISKPYSERSTLITYGKVISKKPVEVIFDDGSKTNCIIKHSAYADSGSSGSVVLNEICEIAGITIGGGKDIFRNFKSGYAMPSEQINIFLSEWKNNYTNSNKWLKQ